MDATTQTLLITTIAGLVTMIVKSFFDERKRREDREQDRLDRQTAAKLTAEHRNLMADKMDTNTAVSMLAAQNADVAATVAQRTEHNTNGLKDELVALTAKASFAEGVKEGERRTPEV